MACGRDGRFSVANARGPRCAGSIDKDVHSDGFAVLDLSVSYALTDQLTLQGLLLNATDEVAITSHRPFGARPNRPRSLIGRIRYEF